MKPFRIEIKTRCVAPAEQLQRNAALNAEYPRFRRSVRHDRRLAVVGGGPLVVHDLDELRAWDGDIWGINYTAEWLNDNGVKATLFSVDPTHMIVEAPDALLATVCDPDLVRHFDGRVQVFDLLESCQGGIAGGITSATRAPALSFAMGYVDVSFFGCEGSFDKREHVDRDEGKEPQLIVRAGGKDYGTVAEYLLQCEQLSLILRTLTGAYHNRSGGLLKAMIENPDTWEIVAVSAEMKEHLEAVNGPQGMYEGQYIPAA